MALCFYLRYRSPVFNLTLSGAVMSEPITLYQMFHLYRHELGFSFIAALVAVFRHWQMKHPFRDIVTSGFLCAAFAFGISTVLDYFGIEGQKWGYLASVFLGYVGVETALDAISEKLPFLGRVKRVSPTEDQNDAKPNA